MAVGHVRADHEEGVGAVEVLVGAGRPVRAQRELVAGAGARHAQAGVGLDPVRPYEALRQLVGEVLRLQRHLPGHVEGQGVGTVLVEDRPQPPGDRRDRRVHVRFHGLDAALGTDERGRGPPGGGHHVGAGRALRAEPSEVRRVELVPGGLPGRAPAGGRIPACLEHDAAADSAVGADRPYALRLRIRHRHRDSFPRPAGLARYEPGELRQEWEDPHVRDGRKPELPGGHVPWARCVNRPAHRSLHGCERTGDAPGHAVSRGPCDRGSPRSPVRRCTGRGYAILVPYASHRMAWRSGDGRSTARTRRGR